MRWKEIHHKSWEKGKPSSLWKEMSRSRFMHWWTTSKTLTILMKMSMTWQENSQWLQLSCWEIVLEGYLFYQAMTLACIVCLPFLLRLKDEMVSLQETCNGLDRLSKELRAGNVIGCFETIDRIDHLMMQKKSVIESCCCAYYFLSLFTSVFASKRYSVIKRIKECISAHDLLFLHFLRFIEVQVRLLNRHAVNASFQQI